MPKQISKPLLGSLIYPSELKKGLILHLPMNEGKGKIIHDISGNRNNGTLVGVTHLPIWTPNGLSFDGVDGKVDITSGQVVGSGAVSFGTWIYLNGWGGSNLGRIAGNGQMSFYVSSGENLLYFSSNGIVSKYSAINAISLSRLYYVVATRNSTGLTNLYINGVLSGTANETSGTPVSGTTDLIIGGRSDNLRNFNGFIDDVRIYNRVLSVDEIKYLFLNKYRWSEKK